MGAIAAKYLARQDSGWNGAFAETEFYLATTPDGFDEHPISRVTFSKQRTPQAVNLESPVTGRYLRVRVLSEVNGNVWGSAAELAVIGVR